MLHSGKGTQTGTAFLLMKTLHCPLWEIAHISQMLLEAILWGKSKKSLDRNCI